MSNKQEKPWWGSLIFYGLLLAVCYPFDRAWRWICRKVTGK